MTESDKKRLLVVDGNRDFAEKLADTLTAAGYLATTCATAKEALAASKTKKVHIAVVEAILPDLSGLKLLDQLLDQDPRLGVVMITGKVSEEIAVKALNMGAFGSVYKYCDPQEILAHIRRAVQHQKAMERADFSRSLYRTIFERSSDGICILNSADQCLVSDLNLPFARIFGLPREEIAGKTLFELGPSDEPRGIGVIIQPLLAKRSGVLDDVRVCLPDGRFRDLEIRTGPLRGDQAGPVQVLVRDISEDKRMRERIAHSDKLALLGEFTSRVAHEVRNPLAGIKGALEVLRLKEDGDDEKTRVINTIFNRIDQLDVFIRDLLQFAKPARPEPSLIPAAELLPRVVSLTRTDPAFTNIKINLDLEKNATVYVDPVALQLVMTNLLRNASKAMDMTGTIRISLRHTYPDVIILVEDSGPGFKEEPEDCFAPFTTSHSDGTGLGLSIARNLIEAHGGSITASNLPKGGARLEILLPGPPGGA